MARLSLEPSGTLILLIDGQRAGGSLQGVFYIFSKIFGKSVDKLPKILYNISRTIKEKNNDA